MYVFVILKVYEITEKYKYFKTQDVSYMTVMLGESLIKKKRFKASMTISCSIRENVIISSAYAELRLLFYYNRSVIKLAHIVREYF